ncbi:MAG TPA: hypothetical protein VJ600_06475 [Holophagaceae bacterium]|nr:hypothetical protein [Holophagaceae bacterium]
MPAPSSGSFLRTVMGIALGAIAMIALKGVIETWVRANLHTDPANQSMSTLIVLLCDFSAAGAGGYLAAWIARGPRAANILAVVILLLGLLYQTTPADPSQASWYRLALLLVAPLGVYTGGWLKGA